jgi:hypothetical protein
MNDLYAMQVRSISGGNWDLIENIKADRLEFGGSQSPVRIFLLADGTSIEFPANQFVFKFSPNREALINRNNQAAQVEPAENR